jgi:3-dehydroquinate synthetase
VTAYFGRGLLSEMERPDVVVIDRNVADRHELPWDSPRIDVEARKDVETWRMLLGAFMRLRLDRDAVVAAVGGGTLLDVAGFAAATYLRGVRWTAVPTTLLAQVDAAHGGKTGLDDGVAKNLIGAFHAPVDVWCEELFLETLPPREVKGGMAEMIKHAVIGAPELLSAEHLIGEVERAARVKLEIVARDPFEKGERRLLNLGHTLGHGVERASRGGLHHGEAVAIGLRAACRIAEEHCGFLERARVEVALDRCGLPTATRLNPREVYVAMRHDKKRKGDTLRWVLPVALGDCRVFDDVPPTLVDAAVARVCQG